MLRPYAEHKMLNTDQLREVVTQRDQSITISKINRIVVSGLNRNVVTIDDNPVPQPLSVVAKYLKAPAPFLASSDQLLSQHIIDHQLNRVKDEREIVFRDGKAIADQPEGSIRLSGAQIIDKMITAAGEMRHANFYDMGDHVDVCLIGDKVEMKPKVNDITEGGLRCRYSEIMARKPMLEPYVERLICTNGMVIRDRIEAFTFNTMDQFLRQFDDAVVSSMNYIDTAIRAQLDKAVATKVERSEQALRTIFTNQRLPAALLGPSIQALMEEDDGTAFGVLQAITRAANTMPYSRRLLLQETGAKEMARLEVAHCPTCWSTEVAH